MVGPNNQNSEIIVEKTIQKLRKSYTYNDLVKAKSYISAIPTPSRDILKLEAELLFLLAKKAKKDGRISEATKFGEKAIEIYEEINVRTLNDAAPFLWWLLPEYMHENIVKRDIFDEEF